MAVDVVTDAGLGLRREPEEEVKEAPKGEEEEVRNKPEHVLVPAKPAQRL